MLETIILFYLMKKIQCLFFKAYKLINILGAKNNSYLRDLFNQAGFRLANQIIALLTKSKEVKRIKRHI